MCHRLMDTHAHALLNCDRSEAGQFALYAETGLRAALRLDAAFEPARFWPIRDPRHLKHSVRYFFRQEEHHGTAFDPWHEGSSLPDLLGMREIGGETSSALLHSLLPRLQRSELLGWVGASELDLVEPDLQFAAEAALAFTGMPSFEGNRGGAWLARHLLVHTVDGESAGRIAGISARAVRRLRAIPLEPDRAERFALQLRWRTLRSRKAEVSQGWPDFEGR